MDGALVVRSIEEINDAAERLRNQVGGIDNRPTRGDSDKGDVEASHDDTCTSQGCVGQFSVDVEDRVYRGFVRTWKLTPLAGGGESRTLQVSIPRLSFNFTMTPSFIVPNADLCHLFATGKSPMFQQIGAQISDDFYRNCYDSRHVRAEGVFSPEEPPFYAFREWQVSAKETKAMCGSGDPDPLALRQAISIKVMPDMLWTVYQLTDDIVIDGILCVSVDETTCVTISGNPQEIEIPSSDHLTVSLVSASMAKPTVDFSVAVRSTASSDGSLKPQSMRAIRGATKEQMSTKGSFGDVRTSCYPDGASLRCRVVAADFGSDMSNDVIEQKEELYDSVFSSYVLEREMKGFFCHKGTCVNLDDFGRKNVQWIGFIALLLITAASAIVMWASSRQESLAMGQCVVKRPMMSKNRTYSQYGGLPGVDDIIGTSGAIVPDSVPMTSDRRPTSTQLSFSELNILSVKLSLKGQGFKLEPNDDISNIKSFEVQRCEMHSAEKGSFCEWKATYSGIADSFQVSCSPHRCLRDSISLHDGSNSNRMGVECPGVSREDMTICINSASQNICTTAKVMEFKDMQDDRFGDIGDEDSNPSPKANQRFWNLLTFNWSVCTTWFIAVIVSATCTSLIIPNLVMLMMMPCSASATPLEVVVMTTSAIDSLLVFFVCCVMLATLRKLKVMTDRQCIAGMCSVPLLSSVNNGAEANVVRVVEEEIVAATAGLSGLDVKGSDVDNLWFAWSVGLACMSLVGMAIILVLATKTRREVMMLLMMTTTVKGETCSQPSGAFQLQKTLVTPLSLQGCYLPYDGYVSCPSGKTCKGKYFTMTSDSTSVTFTSQWPIYPEYGVCISGTSQLVSPCSPTLGPSIPCTRRTIYSQSSTVMVGCKYYPLEYFCSTFNSGTLVLNSGTTAVVCPNITAGCTGPAGTTWTIAKDYDGSLSVRACVAGNLPDMNVVAVQVGAPASFRPTSYCANAATNAEIINGFSFAKAGLTMTKATRMGSLLTCTSNICTSGTATLTYNPVNGAIAGNGLWGDCSVGMLLGTENFIAMNNASMCKTRVSCKAANNVSFVSTIRYEVAGNVDYVGVNEATSFFAVSPGAGSAVIRNTSGEVITMRTFADSKDIEFTTTRTTTAGLTYFGRDAYGSFPDCFKPVCKGVDQLASIMRAGQNQKLPITQSPRQTITQGGVSMSDSGARCHGPGGLSFYVTWLLVLSLMRKPTSGGVATAAIVALIQGTLVMGAPQPSQIVKVTNVECLGQCEGGNVSIKVSISPKLREVRVKIGKTCTVVLDTTLSNSQEPRYCVYPSVSFMYTSGNLSITGEMDAKTRSSIMVSGSNLKEMVSCESLTLVRCSSSAIQERAIPQTCDNAGVNADYCNDDKQEIALTSEWSGGCEDSDIPERNSMCVEMVDTKDIYSACAFYPYYKCDSVKVLHTTGPRMRGDCGLQRALTNFKDPDFWDLQDPVNLMLGNVSTKLKISAGDYVSVAATTGWPGLKDSTSFPFTAYLGFNNQSEWNEILPSLGKPWASKIADSWYLTDISTAAAYSKGASMFYYLCSYGYMNSLTVVANNESHTNFMIFPLAISDTNLCGASVVGFYPQGMALEKVYVHVVSTVSIDSTKCQETIRKAIGQTVTSTGDYSITELHTRKDGSFAAEHVTVEITCSGSCSHRMEYAGKKFSVTQRPKDSSADRRVQSTQWKRDSADADDLFVEDNSDCDESTSMLYDGARMISVKPGIGSLQLSCDVISEQENGGTKLGCDMGAYWAVLNVCNMSVAKPESGPFSTEVDGFPAKVLNRRYKINVSPVDLNFRPADGTIISRAGRQYVGDGSMILSHDNGKSLVIKTAGDLIDVSPKEPRRTLLSFASGGLRSYSVTGKHQNANGFINGWSALLSNFPLAVYIPVLGAAISMGCYMVMVIVTYMRVRAVEKEMAKSKDKKSEVNCWRFSPWLMMTVLFAPALLMCRSSVNLYRKLKEWGDVTGRGLMGDKAMGMKVSTPPGVKQTTQSAEDEARQSLTRRSRKAV